jgi:flagellin-like hook-associated protein FlgL
MRELAMQSANGTMGAPSEGDPMNAEGTATSPSDVQGKANTVHKSLAPFRGKEFGGVVVASALGVDGANGNTQGSTGGAVSGIASAIQKLGSLREDVGAATGRRMNPHEGSLDTMTRTSASTSTPVTENPRPRLSADDAEGLAKRTGSQLSMQPSLGIHTQANVSPRVALSLLQH